MYEERTLLLIGFATVVGALLALDLGVLNRRAHVVTMRAALIWSAVWVGCAMAFNAVLPFWLGGEAALQFLTGYLIELSLSIDNLFVFVLLFTRFRVPESCQHRVLFWGVLGAIAMRVVMIWAGAAVVERFHWVLYVFGAFLVVTGARMLMARAEAEAPSSDRLVEWLSRRLPVAGSVEDGRFFTRVDGRLAVTPLLIVLIAVELADLMFAVDSVPAIFAVTTDPFLVATSNIFAILGLRSMYFALAGLSKRLRFLKQGLAVVLAFIGAKILLAGIWPIPIAAALAVTVGIIGVAVAASLLVPPAHKPEHGG
jgi:tellurite resistance protein TerC